MDAASPSACPNCFGDLTTTPCPHCGWQPNVDNPPPALALGTLLDGRYRIGRVLGHGGFGITYLARDENLQLRLAIKEYLPRDCATRAPDGVSLAIYSGQAGEQFAYGLDRFLEEARALARFDQHPGIVTVKSFFRAHGTGYCVMDYVEGLTLKQYLERQPGGRIPVEQAWRLLAPVMDALRAVHKEGLLHRDLAPDNIYITREGRVKLLDFGAARFAAGEHSRSLSIILKPGYAPEEQYRTRGKQGPWTDVYGLAATLYRAITGTVPPEALDRLDQDDLVTPSRLGIAIPAGQEAVLLKALAVKADARYPSMQGLLEGWRALQSEQAKPHPPKDPIGSQASDTTAPDSARSLPENPNRRGIGWLLAVVVIGVMAFAGLGAFFEADDPTLPEPPTTQDVVPTTPSTPPPVLSSRYRPLGADGSIIEDQTTGLQWMRCSQGQHWNGATCEGAASKVTWEEAMQQPRGGSFAGYTDWRVPTKDELRTLVYCSSGRPETWSDTDAPCEGDFEHPTIDQVAFPVTPDSWFWSSSPDAYISDHAWYVRFSSGSVNGYDKSGTGYVRLVRGGPPIRDATPTPQPAPPPQVMSDRYRPLGADGSIIEDRTTGLHWMRCSQGQQWNGAVCDGDASKLTWDEAMQQPKGLSFGGYADWRVPTKDELLTLVYCSSGQPKAWNDTGDFCKGEFERPTIDQVAFPNTLATLFWSSSPGADDSDGAWYVGFDDGSDGYVSKSNGYEVRLVRGALSSVSTLPASTAEIRIEGITPEVQHDREGVGFEMPEAKSIETTQDLTPNESLSVTAASAPSNQGQVPEAMAGLAPIAESTNDPLTPLGSLDLQAALNEASAVRASDPQKVQSDVIDSQDVSEAFGIDLTVVPGMRVGAIDYFTTRSDLVSLFGSENVVDVGYTSPESTTPSTEIYTGDTREATIVWEEGKGGVQVSHVIISGGAWKLSEGIRIGDDVSSTERRNGRSFKIFGFGWDYGGMASFDGGRLDGLSIALQFAPAQDTPDISSSVFSDSLFSSDDSAMRAANPHIILVYITLAPEFQNPKERADCNNVISFLEKRFEKNLVDNALTSDPRGNHALATLTQIIRQFKGDERCVWNGVERNRKAIEADGRRRISDQYLELMNQAISKNKLAAGRAWFDLAAAMDSENPRLPSSRETLEGQ